MELYDYQDDSPYSHYPESDYYPEDEDGWYDDGIDFAEPGGESALRAETEDNPRNLSCPSCGARNVLTPADEARGYQCDACARTDERGF